ncbi:hypothetical protein BT67DRAFT_433551 [Trichocladium antarcticum]|uniref:Uncharacterized protein n=1 Tax=Trichocladium antarcticum TaxID=1450529 RepID=A0AAN6ULX7_9PEZI|nr:hypothetical protein BT67DRAFT_433551 [Trichocladium antarcticum]
MAPAPASPPFDLRAQIIEAHVTLVIAKEPLGTYKAIVLRTEGGIRGVLLSETASSAHDALQALHVKSAEAVQNHISSNGFDVTSRFKKRRSKHASHDDGDDSDSASTAVTAETTDSTCEFLSDNETISVVLADAGRRRRKTGRPSKTKSPQTKTRRSRPRSRSPASSRRVLERMPRLTRHAIEQAALAYVRRQQPRDTTTTTMTTTMKTMKTMAGPLRASVRSVWVAGIGYDVVGYGGGDLTRLAVGLGGPPGAGVVRFEVEVAGGGGGVGEVLPPLPPLSLSLSLPVGGGAGGGGASGGGMSAGGGMRTVPGGGWKAADAVGAGPPVGWDGGFRPPPPPPPPPPPSAEGQGQSGQPHSAFGIDDGGC